MAFIRAPHGRECVIIRRGCCVTEIVVVREAAAFNDDPPSLRLIHTVQPAKRHEDTRTRVACGGEGKEKNYNKSNRAREEETSSRRRPSLTRARSRLR